MTHNRCHKPYQARINTYQHVSHHLGEQIRSQHTACQEAQDALASRHIMWVSAAYQLASLGAVEGGKSLSCHDGIISVSQRIRAYQARAPASRLQEVSSQYQWRITVSQWRINLYHDVVIRARCVLASRPCISHPCCIRAVSTAYLCVS